MRCWKHNFHRFMGCYLRYVLVVWLDCIRWSSSCYLKISPYCFLVDMGDCVVLGLAIFKIGFNLEMLLEVYQKMKSSWLCCCCCLNLFYMNILFFSKFYLNLTMFIWCCFVRLPVKNLILKRVIFKIKGMVGIGSEDPLLRLEKIFRKKYVRQIS